MPDEGDEQNLGCALIERVAARFILEKGAAAALEIALNQVAYYENDREETALALWRALLEAIEQNQRSAQIH